MTSGDALLQVLHDKSLARFGDSYINFAFSLAATNTKGVPQGTKVSDRILAEAARRSGIREKLPKRTKRSDTANAVEALLGHAYLNGKLSLQVTVDLLSKNLDSPAYSIAELVTYTLGLLGEQ